MAKVWKFVRAMLSALDITDFNAEVTILEIYPNGDVRFEYDDDENIAIFVPDSDEWIFSNNYVDPDYIVDGYFN